jgi:23S rRNA U2552 (ribose-2'-O)-methylase RlmE/FtsJ
VVGLQLIIKKHLKHLEDVYKNYKKYIDGAKRQSYRSRTEFSLEKMSENILNILEEKYQSQYNLNFLN